MVILVSSDEKIPMYNHFYELLEIIRVKVLFFILFCILWSLLIEKVIFNWIKLIKIDSKSIDLSIYGPYEWIEIQWTMVFLLSLISIMPYISYSLRKFSKSGLLPNEKSWFSIMLLLNLFLVPITMIFIWVIILPFLLSSFAINDGIEGVENHYDISSIFKLTLGISWIMIVFSFTTISMSLARLIGLLDSNNSNLRGKLLFFSGSILVISLPNEFDGLRIIIALIIIILSDLISRSIPKYPIGKRSFNVTEMISSNGNKDRIAVVDCSCEGVCPKFPPNFKPEGIAIPICTAICLNDKEQDSIVEMIARYNISQLIISGCDGTPLPQKFNQSLKVANCKLSGLNWLDSEFSSDEIWQFNSLNDSINL